MDAVRDFRRRTFASLSVRNFRLFAIAQGVSMCGTWMQIVAQGLLVLHLTGSGTALGFVIALQTLPILLLGPYGGLIADRFPKRKILYLTQAAAAAMGLLLGTLVIGGWVQLWMVYAIGIVSGLIKVFDNPTQQVFVREMVGPEHLANAVSLNATESNVARAIGPSIAGALIVTVGMGACFIIDGLSYAVVIFALAAMHLDELHPAPRVVAAKGQLIAGLRYVRSSPVMFNLLLMLALVGLFTYEFSVILPIFSEFALKSGSSGYAALTGAMGAGSVAGGLYAASHRHATPKKLAAASLGFGIAVWLVAASPTLVFAVGGMLIVGFFSINFQSIGNVVLQMESRVDMQGRVMALYTVAFLGTTPIGGPLQGWIGQHAGARWSLVIGGSAAITAAGLGLLTARRREHDAHLHLAQPAD